MKLKKLLIAFSSIFIVCLIAFCISKFSDRYSEEAFISNVEKNSIFDEEEKSELIEIYNDPDMSDEDRKEFFQLVEQYPGLLASQKDFQYEIVNFNIYKSDFEVLLNSVISYIDENHYEEPYYIGFYEEDGNFTLKRGGFWQESNALEVDASVNESMKKIEDYFDVIGHYFSVIRVENGSVRFDTENGKFSIIYSLDGISPEEKGMDIIGTRKYRIGNISGDWYYASIKNV